MRMADPPPVARFIAREAVWRTNFVEVKNAAVENTARSSLQRKLASVQMTLALKCDSVDAQVAIPACAKQCEVRRPQQI
jgi:hypothetical protein